MRRDIAPSAEIEATELKGEMEVVAGRENVGPAGGVRGGLMRPVEGWIVLIIFGRWIVLIMIVDGGWIVLIMILNRRRMVLITILNGRWKTVLIMKLVGRWRVMLIVKLVGRWRVVLIMMPMGGLMGRDKRVRLTTVRNSPSLKTKSSASHDFDFNPPHTPKSCGDGQVAKSKWQKNLPLHLVSHTCI